MYCIAGFSTPINMTKKRGPQRSNSVQKDTLRLGVTTCHLNRLPCQFVEPDGLDFHLGNLKNKIAVI